jgi:hypothetical protein
MIGVILALLPCFYVAYLMLDSMHFWSLFR